MKNPSSYFKIGLFVISATFLLCSGVIFLGASKIFEKTITIETYMEQSVEGIGPGSAIKYLGISFGEVGDVLLADTRYQPGAMREGKMGGLILVELKVKTAMLPAGLTKEELVNWLDSASDSGLRARTATSGLTGPAFIEFVYVDPVEFPAIALDWAPPEYYVPSAPSTTQIFISIAESILRKVERINFDSVINDVDELLNSAANKIDGFDSQSISENVLAFIQEMRESNKRLRDILENPHIEPSIEDLSQMLENAKHASAEIKELLDDPRLDSFLTEIESSSRDVSPALDDFRSAVRRIDRFIELKQVSIDQLVAEMNEALQNITVITEDMKMNPSRSLFGDPPPKSKHGEKP